MVLRVKGDGYVRSRILTIAAAGLVCIGSVWIIGAEEKDIAPNGKGLYTLDHPQNGNGNGGGKPNRPGSSGISYHGGPVILGTTNVYYIWYGNWGTNTAKAILTDLANGIGGDRKSVV